MNRVAKAILRILKRAWESFLSLLSTFISLLIPRTSWGRWSLCLALVSLLPPILLGIGTGFNPLGAGIETALLVILKIIFIAMSGDAFVIGLLGIIRYKERHPFVFIAVAIGVWLCLGELAWLVHFSESIYPLGFLE